MEFWDWFGANWFDFISTVGLIATLAFTASSLRSETKTRRIANLLAVTANHREIWSMYVTRPELARVRDPHADLKSRPVTEAERTFVNTVIQHVNSVFQAMDDDLIITADRLRSDVGQFFSLPIPNAIWHKLKPFQNGDFIRFVDDCLRR